MVIPAASLARPAPGELAPASPAQAAELMAELARRRQVVAFAGGGTEPWPVPAPRGTVVLRTTGMAAVREHAPADQIVIAEAGLTLAALQRHLAPHRQRLALDPPFPERATLGGIVAANAFGPRRTRSGSVRDLIIGATLIRADGTRARGGGKVVKNVAGFDLPRLLCGSQGMLGLVAEVAFRLHPLPEASETVVVEGVDPAAGWALVRSTRLAQLEPAAVAALPDGERYHMVFRFEGFGPGVRDQVERLLASVRGEGRSGARLSPAEEEGVWARHDQLRTAGDVRARASFLPAGGPAALAALRPLARSLVDGAIVAYPSLGIAFVTGTLQDAEPTAAALAGARRAVERGNGSVVLASAPAPLREQAGIFGMAPPALAVMRRLRAAFDPEERLAPGRLPEGVSP